MAKSKNSKNRSYRSSGRLGRILARILFWTVFVGTVAAAFVGVGTGLRHVFYLANPHFQLRQIVVSGNDYLKPEQVKSLLENPPAEFAAAAVHENATNLFACDLPQLRAILEQNVLIRRANVRRRLPGTLTVEIVERQPVAQFISRGRNLLDDQAWLLPTRLDHKIQYLPIITGVRDAGSFQPGQQIDDPMVQAALYVLQLLATNDYGRYFDVATIQLRYPYPSGRLIMHLRQRETFRDEAQVILPVDDLEMALRRVHVVVLDRTRGQQRTSFIDATYRRNVPVLP